MANSQNSDVSLTRRALWLLVAKVLAFAFNLALPLLLVRRLSQDQFGLYKQAFLVIGTALALLPLGFQMSAFYFLSRERERQGQIILNILLFHLVMGALGCFLLVAAPDLLGTVFHSQSLVPYGPVIGLVVFFWVLSSFLEVVSVANQDARLSTLFIVTSQLSKTSLLLAAAVGWGSIQSLINAAAIQGMLQTVVLLIYLRSRFPRFWTRFNWTTLRVQLSYALPFGFAGLLYTIQIDLHHYFVSNRFDAATYAVYAVGCFNIPLVGILSESVASVLIPRLSLLQKNANHREVLELTARVMRKLALVYFPLYAFLIVMGREFITALFTRQYASSWPIFAINLTLLPLSIMAMDPIMRAYAQHRHFLIKLYAVLIVLLAVGLWFGISRFGLIGAISIVVGVNVIGRLTTAAKITRILGVAWGDVKLFRDIPRVAALAVVAGVTTAFVRSMLSSFKPVTMLVICGGVFAAVFATGVVILGLLSIEERLYVRKFVARIWRPALKRAAEPLARG